jgi:predicted transcriptional regulator
MSNSANPSPEHREDTAAKETPVDELFDVLTDVRRRHVLSVLSGRQSAMDVESLSDAVAAREYDADPSVLSESTIHEVHVTLHHVHLPKLADSGLIEYDRDDRTVETTETTDGVPIDIE